LPIMEIALLLYVPFIVLVLLLLREHFALEGSHIELQPVRHQTPKSLHDNTILLML